jgi:hypothetical protein
MVEASSVALGLRVSRRWLRDRLDPAVQERVEARPRAAADWVRRWRPQA